MDPFKFRGTATMERADARRTFPGSPHRRGNVGSSRRRAAMTNRAATDDDFLVIFDSPDGRYSVMVEADARVAYAYLLEDGKIIGDVWLYNVAPTPSSTNWKDRNQMPFLNPTPFAAAQDAYDVRDGVECRWTDRRVEILRGAEPVAVLVPGAKPGWSKQAQEDGPLAKTLSTAP